MDLPLEPIAYLGRSSNRVEVLETLSADPRTRQQLREELSMSRTTLARILNELEEREWITRQGDKYTTSPASEAILAKFDPLLDTLWGIESLGEAVHWLPPPAQAVDLRHFESADIIQMTDANPVEPFDRLAEVLDAADRWRSATRTAIPRITNALADRLEEGTLDYGAVIASGYIEAVDNPVQVASMKDLAATGETWVYHGELGISFHIIDGNVLIWLSTLTEGELEIYGLLESDNAAVLSWAESLYEEYRDESELLEPTMIPSP